MFIGLGFYSGFGNVRGHKPVSIITNKAMIYEMLLICAFI